MAVTVLLTNRKLKNGKFTEGRGDEIRMAHATPIDIPERIRQRVGPPAKRKFRTIERMKKTYQLDLVDAGAEATELAKIAQSAPDKPWLFFLHGNNQTTEKNLKKSRVIQERYDVNLVIFSWPSRSFSPKLSDFVPVAGIASSVSVGLGIGGLALSGVNHKKKQYKKAREIAKLTAPQFVEAFSLARDHLLVPLKNANDPHTCLLVHSLGHKVLRHAVEDHEGLEGYEFDHVMLHQADEVNMEHVYWVEQLKLGANANTAITRNRKDLVLYASGVINHGFKAPFSRLGNRDKADVPNGPFQYLEFGGLDGVGHGHGIAWDQELSEEVEALTRPLLTGA